MSALPEIYVVRDDFARSIHVAFIGLVMVAAIETKSKNIYHAMNLQLGLLHTLLRTLISISRFALLT